MQAATLNKGTKITYNYENGDAYRFGKTHGEIFTTGWSVDYEPLSSIIEDMKAKTTYLWSVACLKEYDFKVTFRFIGQSDADYFQSKYCSECERKVLLV